jgi:hypothetical protein
MDTDNWAPFANGVSGILKGVSAVSFAYIGLAFISTLKSVKIHNVIYLDGMM